MKLQCLFLYLTLTIMHSKAQLIPVDRETETFTIYTGKDLGLTYTPQQAQFKIWAPTASKAQLKLYSAPLGGTPTQVIDLKKATEGTWAATLTGNYAGNYYTFCIEYKGKWLSEVPDPYAKAVGTNGRRAMVVDLTKTNPDGWAHT